MREGERAGAHVRRPGLDAEDAVVQRCNEGSKAVNELMHSMGTNSAGSRGPRKDTEELEVGRRRGRGRVATTVRGDEHDGLGEGFLVAGSNATEVGKLALGNVPAADDSRVAVVVVQER